MSSPRKALNDGKDAPRKGPRSRSREDERRRDREDRGPDDRDRDRDRRSRRSRSATPDLRAVMTRLGAMETTITQKVNSLKTELTQHVEAKASETLTAAKAYTDEKLATVQVQSVQPALQESALLKIRAASERALRNDNAHIVLLSNYTPQDTEAARKAAIDEVATAISKRPRKVEHVKIGGNLTQFSRVEFESAISANAFISKWIAMKKQNTAGRPVYARCDMAKELRALRAPLVKAEKAVKQHFRTKNEKHLVKTGNWPAGGELLVDKVPVARLTGLLTVEWADKALEAAVASDMEM